MSANPNDVVSVIEGVGGLLAIIGVPVAAAIVAPLSLLARGLTGLFSKKKKEVDVYSGTIEEG